MIVINRHLEHCFFTEQENQINTSMNFKQLFILFFICHVGNVFSQQIITFPASDSIPHNNDFTVKVRIPGGQWQDLYEYEALVDMHRVTSSSMVNFDFSGTVEFSVTYNREKFERLVSVRCLMALNRR